MKKEMLPVLVLLWCLTGCASYRFTTTLKPTAKPPAVRSDVRFCIGSTRYLSAGEWPAGTYVESFGTNAAPGAQLKAWLTEAAGELYPDTFADSPSAVALDVTVERTRYEAIPSAWACLSCVSLLIIPTPDVQQNDYSVRVSAKDGVLNPLLEGSVQFKREDAGWLALSPLGLIPPFGRSDLGKVSEVGSDRSNARARQLTVNSCVEAVVQILRRIDAQQLEAAADRQKKSVSAPKEEKPGPLPLTDSEKPPK